MMHLLLDLYGCSPDLLAKEAHLRRFLNEMPKHLGMQNASLTSLYYIDAVSDPTDAGHSGLTLASNHVSLHAWPPFRMVNIDIFSCDEFDETEAIAFARTMFSPADIEKNLIHRATRSPRQSGAVDILLAHTPVVVESKAEPPPVVYRCLWPGGCTRSIGSAMMRYCAVHKDLLLPP